MFKIKIDIPIYFGYLILIITDDFKPLEEKFSPESIDYPAFVKGMKDKDGVAEYYMVFNTKHICHTIIAHEVTHCANWIFHDTNIKPDLLNDEPYAYLVGWITGKIYKYASKNNLNIR